MHSEKELTEARKLVNAKVDKLKELLTEEIKANNAELMPGLAIVLVQYLAAIAHGKKDFLYNIEFAHSILESYATEILQGHHEGFDHVRD